MYLTISDSYLINVTESYKHRGMIHRAVSALSMHHRWMHHILMTIIH